MGWVGTVVRAAWLGQSGERRLRRKTVRATGWVYEQHLPAALDQLRAARVRHAYSPNSTTKVMMDRAEEQLNNLLESLHAMQSNA